MNRKILLVLLMLAFAGYAGWNFVDSVTPYVGVAAAQKTAGNVQVKGVLDKTAEAPHMENGYFIFTIQDEDTGESMMVHSSRINYSLNVPLSMSSKKASKRRNHVCLVQYY